MDNMNKETENLRLPSKPATAERMFAGEIKRMLEERYGGRFRLSVDEVTKNNGLRLTGISIGERDSCLSVIIYLDDWLPQFMAGRSMESILNEFMDIYRMKYDRLESDIGILYDFGKCAENICFRLVNAEMNAGMLSEIPHRPFLDLAVIYYIPFRQDDNATFSYTVTDKILGLWRTDEETLYGLAMKNTPKMLKGLISPVSDVIEIILRPQTENEIYMGGDSAGRKLDVPIYVSYNNRGINGAATLLYDGMIREFAGIVGSLYILPSSIHEVLLLPASCNRQTPEELKQMVSGVNKNEVQPDEVLSDSVYFYDAKDGKFSIVA